jgi:hypothetical protein
MCQNVHIAPGLLLVVESGNGPVMLEGKNVAPGATFQKTALSSQHPCTS